MEPALHVNEIISEVARAKHELRALKVSPARKRICRIAVNDLAATLDGILTEPWIPRDGIELHAAILGTLQNIEAVEQMIVDAAVPMLERKRADELFRFNIALLDLATLRFTLDVLFDAAAATATRLMERYQPQLDFVN